MPYCLQLGAKHTDKIYIRDYHNKITKHVDSIGDAEKYTDELAKVYNHPIVHAEIIYEKENQTNFCVIDLPGSIDDPKYQQYFEQLKKTYIDKKETVILHVAKADDDRETDISTKFLGNCQNTIITVLTHADYWKDDKEKMNCAIKHINDPRVKSLAIVSNKTNEIELLNSMEIQFKTDKQIIISYCQA